MKSWIWFEKNWTKEHQMEIINYLGYILANELDISPAAARGLLKLAIKDQFGPYKPILELQLNDFKKIVADALKNRLIDLKVKDLEKLLEFIERELIINQSLITITRI